MKELIANKSSSTVVDDETLEAKSSFAATASLPFYAEYSPFTAAEFRSAVLRSAPGGTGAAAFGNLPMTPSIPPNSGSSLRKGRFGCFCSPMWMFSGVIFVIASLLASNLSIYFLMSDSCSDKIAKSAKSDNQLQASNQQSGLVSPSQTVAHLIFTLASGRPITPAVLRPSASPKVVQPATLHIVSPVMLLTEPPLRQTTKDQITFASQHTALVSGSDPEVGKYSLETVGLSAISEIKPAIASSNQSRNNNGSDEKKLPNGIAGIIELEATIAVRAPPSPEANKSSSNAAELRQEPFPADSWNLITQPQTTIPLALLGSNTLPPFMHHGPKVPPISEHNREQEPSISDHAIGPESGVPRPDRAQVARSEPGLPRNLSASSRLKQLPLLEAKHRFDLLPATARIDLVGPPLFQTSQTSGRPLNQDFWNTETTNDEPNEKSTTPWENSETFISTSGQPFVGTTTDELFVLSSDYEQSEFVAGDVTTASTPPVAPDEPSIQTIPNYDEMSTHQTPVTGHVAIDYQSSHFEPSSAEPNIASTSSVWGTSAKTAASTALDRSLFFPFKSIGYRLRNMASQNSTPQSKPETSELVSTVTSVRPIEASVPGAKTFIASNDRPSETTISFATTSELLKPPTKSSGLQLVPFRHRLTQARSQLATKTYFPTNYWRNNSRFANLIIGPSTEKANEFEMFQENGNYVASTPMAIRDYDSFAEPLLDLPLLPDSLRPFAYEVTWKLPIEEKSVDYSFLGRVVIDFACLSKTKELRLNAADLSIDQASISVSHYSARGNTTTTGGDKRENIQIIETFLDPRNQSVSIFVLERFLPGRNYTVRMEYAGKMSHDSRESGIFGAAYSPPNSTEQTYVYLAIIHANYFLGLLNGVFINSPTKTFIFWRGIKNGPLMSIVC